MAARAMWKGTIRFGSVDVPVKLFSGVQDQSVHFRLLDAKNHEPVVQKMVNPETGDIVSYDEVHRAFPTDDGDLVVLDEAELAELEPEASRDIEITRFLPSGTITHPWYDRPYFLGPDDDEGPYFALAAALRGEEVEGLARWVMRKKEYVGALRLTGDYLMLITLRHAGEVVPASALQPPAGRDLSERELEMAKQLISAMEDEELDMATYQDEYRQRVLDFVEAKAAGQVIKFPRAPRKAKEESLEEMLKKSLASTSKKKKAASA